MLTSAIVTAGAKCHQQAGRPRPFRYQRRLTEAVTWIRVSNRSLDIRTVTGPTANGNLVLHQAVFDIGKYRAFETHNFPAMVRRSV